MTQPSNLPMHFRPTLSNYASAQMTIFNPVPMIRTCPTTPWLQTAHVPTALTEQEEYLTAISATTRTGIHSQAIQIPSQPGQTWKPYQPSPSENTAANQSPLFPPVSMHNNGLNCTGADNSSKATTGTDRCPKLTAGNILRNKFNSPAKVEAERSHTEEHLLRKVSRQRELIGKLISMIVNHLLKNQDKILDLSLKDEDVGDLEKLLNFTDSLKSGRQSFNNSERNSGSNFSSIDRKRRTRTRTQTGEKKHLCKRLRRERKSPKQAHHHSYQRSTSHRSNSLTATLSQPRSKDDGKSPKVHSSNAQFPDSEPHARLVAAVSRKLLDWVQPDGDSQLYSLRLEFARQLKSLEEEFQKECETRKCEKSRSDFCISDQPQKTPPRHTNADDSEITEDSDWLPSSAASSTTVSNRSVSLSSDSTMGTFCAGKKKLPKRKHVRCFKPKQRNKYRPFRAKPHNSSCFKPITARRASGMAMQKIDRMLRPPESDDVSSNVGRSKKFHERALEKIRQSMTLWNRMSAEMNSFFLSDNNKEVDLNEVKEPETTNNIIVPKQEPEQEETNFNEKPKDLEEEPKVEEELAALPNNKTDPSFMLSKFLQFLPDHVETKICISDAEELSPPPCILDENGEADEEEERKLQFNKHLKNEGHVVYRELDSKATSDVFKDNVGFYNNVDGLLSSNLNLPLLCSANHVELIDPDIIGEVIIVPADGNALPEVDSNPTDNPPFSGMIKEEEVVEECFIPKDDSLIIDTTGGNAILECKLQPDSNSDEFLDKLSEQREALSPEAIADRLRQHLATTERCLAEAEELPDLDKSSKQRASHASPLQRMQMFRPLNSEKKQTDDELPTSPSKICITKVMSLNHGQKDSSGQTPNCSAASKKNDPILKVGSTPKEGSKSKDSNKSKVEVKAKEGLKLKEGSKFKEGGKIKEGRKMKERSKLKVVPKLKIKATSSDSSVVNTIKLPDKTKLPHENREKGDLDLGNENPILLQNEQLLARPLKMLLSDMESGKKSDEPGIIEWGLVPRRAMHLAKQRIQKQLCGGEKDDEMEKIPCDNRRLSLRSNIVITGEGDGTGSEVKKIERKRTLIKKTSPSEYYTNKPDVSSAIVTIRDNGTIDDTACDENSGIRDNTRADRI